MTTLAPRARWLRRAGPIFIFLSLLAATPVQAQGTLPPARSDPSFYWGVNVATATLSGLLQGRASRVPVTRALLAGVLGGSTMYAGQRLVGTGEPALRFLGLQTVAVGASVARNISLRRGPVHELTFPVFPLYVRLGLAGRPHVSARVSAVALGGIVHSAREFHVWPDWRQSLVAGMPVFSVPEARLASCPKPTPKGDCAVMGHHVMGAVAYSGRPVDMNIRTILTHELGHSAQDVRDAVLHAVPASDFVLRQDRVGRFLSRFVVLDLVLPLNAVSRAAGPRSTDPACRDLKSFYECETEAMMAR